MKEENIIYDNNKKSKKIVLSIIAVLAVVVGLGLAGTGIFLLSKPKAVFQESFNYMTKVVKNLDLTDYQRVDISTKDKIKVSNNININLNQSLGLGINNIDLKMDVLNDKTSDTTKFYLDSKLDNRKLLELTSYLKDDKVYLMITDIFDKYYYIDADEYSYTVDEITKEDIDLIMDIVKKSFKKVITDDKFEKEKTKTSVEGIEEDVTKLTLKVDDKLVSDLIIETVHGIKASEDALEILSEVSSSSREEIISSLDSIVNSMTETTGETILTYNIYYKNINNIRKLEVLSGTTVMTYTGNGNSYRFKVVDNNVEVMLVLITENGDNYAIAANVGSFKISGNIVKNKNGYKLTLNLPAIGGSSLGTIIVDYVYTSNVQEGLTISYANNGVDLIKVTTDSKITFDEQIALPNLIGAKSMDNMTEAEQDAIMNKLQNHPVIGPFVSMYLPQEDDFTNDDYSENDEYFELEF